VERQCSVKPDQRCDPIRNFLASEDFLPHQANLCWIKLNKGGIHFAQVAPICSVWQWRPCPCNYAWCP